MIKISLNSNVVWSADFDKGLEAYNSKDYVTAIREWKPLAEQGDPYAQSALGDTYYFRLEGTPKDYGTAAYWYKLSANQGFASAQSNLGIMYFLGDGVPKNYETAVYWYKLAAEQGLASAQSSLGIMYSSGRGIEKNYILSYMYEILSGSDGSNVRNRMTNYEYITAKKFIDKWQKLKNKSTDAAESWIELENTIVQVRKDSQDNPGFRDLKPGMPLEDYYKNCVSLNVSQNKCYGIQNIKFSRDIKKIDGVEIITTLYLDMGPISGEDDGSSNLYLDMVKNFNAKYSPDYSFSERDKEVFNAAQKKELLAVYSNGQVVLKISRKTGENTFLEKLWLDIEYRDVKTGKRFLEKNRPVKASLNDF